jgi:chitin synthase
MEFLISGNRTLAECMNDIIRVGFVDSKSMGCIIADIVLYISLVFILAVVGIKFALAVIFSWFFGRRMGSFKKETNEERQKRDKEVEAWTNDIFKPAPAKYRPNVGGAGRTNASGGQGKKGYLPTTSRFTPASRPHSSYVPVGGGEKRQSTFTGSKGFLGSVNANGKASPPDTPVKTSRSNISLPTSSHFGSGGALVAHSRTSSFDLVDSHGRPCPFPLDHNVLAQPPADYQPHHFPLAHTILLVTAYSESVEGLRTTLDSLATTDYPNSHKLILVICDGMVKGSGNDLATPDIVLTMMKDHITPKEDVEPLSYVAVADGHKQHNMAKVYGGFYDYDDETVELSKQQRVPMVLVAKCGNPLEAHDAKPGNRGKRDSQVLLMAFLQKVMFDERMTSFEDEFFNSIWRVTGISADNYEHVLMVDADTKGVSRRFFIVLAIRQLIPVCSLPGFCHPHGSMHGARCRYHGSLRRDQDRQQEGNLGDHDPSVRILHLAPSNKSFRIHVGRRDVLARLFQYVSDKGA